MGLCGALGLRAGGWDPLLGAFAWVLATLPIDRHRAQQLQQTNSSFQFAESGEVFLESVLYLIFGLMLTYCTWTSTELTFAVTVLHVKHTVLVSYCLSLVHAEVYIS